jgi:hypothetical protein
MPALLADAAGVLEAAGVNAAFAVAVGVGREDGHTNGTDGTQSSPPTGLVTSSYTPTGTD